MGVAGSGKTTIGRLLASRMDWPFFEGDDFHPPANVAKMRAGIPLNDGDREAWLSAIAMRVDEMVQKSRSCIFACSALKSSYRSRLKGESGEVRFMYLRGGYDLILKRLESRSGHFMKSTMLASQFEILEEPRHALRIEVDEAPGKIVEKIIHQLF